MNNSGRFIPNPKFIEALTEDEFYLDYEESEFESIDTYFEQKEKCEYINKTMK